MSILGFNGMLLKYIPNDILEENKQLIEIALFQNIASLQFVDENLISDRIISILGHLLQGNGMLLQYIPLITRYKLENNQHLFELALKNSKNHNNTNIHNTNNSG